MQIGLKWWIPHPAFIDPLTIQSLKITVFWGVTLCNLVQVLCPASTGNNSVSAGIYRFILSPFLTNVGEIIPDYIAPYSLK
jgi:hypothetical protein